MTSINNKASAIRVVVLMLTPPPQIVTSNYDFKWNLALLTNQELHLALEVFRVKQASSFIATKMVSAFISQQTSKATMTHPPALPR